MTPKITIIGSGLVGITAACALAPLGIDITLIDSANLNDIRQKKSDGRTCAIAAGSANFFKEIGVWQEMHRHAGEILDIRVTDGNAPVFLHYDHKLIGNQPLGYIIENYYLREALFKKAETFRNIRILAPHQYNNVTFGDKKCSVTLNNNEIITSDLLIAADGKNSAIRKLAGIRSHEWNYDQTAIVCTIAHENHHQNIAQERFLTPGPFAVLPMHGGHHSSLVWTEKTHLAPTYMQLAPAEIEEQITIRTGSYLGKITLASPIFSYPLSLCKAKQYTAPRMCLVGDAAHCMHPLAGQGFNVGIRDIEALRNLLKPDITQLKTPQAILTQYAASRLTDSIALITITDLLNRLFSTTSPPLKTPRRLGLALVNQSKPLKKFFMQHASGSSLR